MSTPAIIVPRTETLAVRRGRALLMEITNRTLELVDRGKTPTRVRIPTALKDDLLAFFDFNFVFDGVLPREYCGLPLEYVPGAERRIEIVCGAAAE